MSVNLCRADARVAQNLLHTPKISPAVEQMSCGCVAKRVRPFGPLTGHFADNRSNDTVHRARGEPSAASADKEIGHTVFHGNC